jgi:hypothetical protein
MDTQTVALAAFAIAAVIVVAAMLIYRRRIKVGLKGLGTELSLEGEDREPAATRTPAAGRGVTMKGIKSRAGSVHAVDRPGQGISMKDIDARGDVRAVSGDSDPKAKPPA